MAAQAPSGRVYDTDELLDAADYLRDVDDSLPAVGEMLEGLKAAADTERTTELSIRLRELAKSFGATEAELFYALAFHTHRMITRSDDPLVAWLAFEHCVEMLGVEHHKAERLAQRDGAPPPCA